jgi:xanthine dehydrogenase molybdenum-binding subunit
LPENKYKLIGQDYVLPDLVAKVTGRAKYSEDFRADGMLFAKLLLSPVPHARIRRVDASAALAMPGVVAVITGEDVPKPQQPMQLGEAAAQRANTLPEVALATEPFYQGEPIVAVAAIDEVTAADAIEKIKVEYEPLPFVVDPIVTLRAGGPNPRSEGNVWRPPQVQEMKISAAEAAELDGGRVPLLENTPIRWEVGDVDAGFKNADYVLDETLVHQSTGHQPMEPRTAMAYWQNGKLFLHGSTQSVARTVANVAQWVDIPQDQVVVISEYTGGGFGGKIPGAQTMAIPAILSKKTGRPVMMRITREEENYIGRARAGIHLRAKIGFRKDGRIVAMDLCAIGDCGPYSNQGDVGTMGANATALYNPESIRFRGVAVLTNTPPRVSQRAPGGEQAAAMLEPMISKAARHLGVDQVAIRKINAPVTGSEFGPPPPPAAAGAAAAAAAASGARAGAPGGAPAVAQPQPLEQGRASGRGQAAAGQVPGQQPVAPAAPPAAQRRSFFTSCHLREALDLGADLFKWDERKGRNGQRIGTKVTGLGVGLGTYTAGSIAMDGLLLVRNDGKVYVHSGIGNLGTGSVMDCSRIVAEELNLPWEQIETVWGNTSKHLAWSSPQAGSQTIHAHTRANLAAAQDLKKKLQEIAALERGGRPESYTVANGRVGPLTFAQAAEAAIKHGGRFAGHEMPADINDMTKASVKGLAGQGLIGVARDNFGRQGNTQSWVAAFAEVEVDVETGKVTLVDYLSVGDVGKVVNPRSLTAQLNGGSCLGIAHALCQKWVIDPQYGVTLARRFHYNKPLTILDIPNHLQATALDLPDPETPVGARGVGEPPVGAGYGAVLNAIADAIGVDAFRRAPVTADIVLMSLEHGRRMHEPLRAHL